MDFQSANKANIKYILGAMLMNEKCGQKCIRDMYEKFKKSGTIRYDRVIVQKFYEQLKEKKIDIIADWAAEFPESLKDLRDAPLILFAKGDKKLLERDSISVVGTRKITIYGGRVTVDLIRRISRKTGIVTVSGLAYGVDGKVHTVSLDNCVPTVAVVAGGIDTGFPRRNYDLYQRIASEGLVISEFPPTRPVFKGMFPMRNRIMAALSGVTVVIEGSARSGSLITAHIAAELGRDVYAVPGDIYRESAKGTNQLISEGAFPLTSLRDFDAILNNL